MKKAELAKKIIIPIDELEKAYISDFNKNVILELSKSEFTGDVDDSAVDTAERLLKSFLDKTWPDNPSAHKYVISSCLALAFLFEKPMHPHEKVKYITRIEGGAEKYYCPYNQKGTICDFCAAVPLDEPETASEYLDIVDENGVPTGETVSREIAHRDGIKHRTAHVWVIRKTEIGYDVLLQKRSMDKDSFPGLYDTSSAGHIPAGDEPLPSALRELYEELGIKAKERELAYAGSFRIKYEKVFHGQMFRDNEVSHVFVYSQPVDISALSLQESEVEEVRWFDMEEVWNEIRTDRRRFCVPTGGLAVLKQYLGERQLGNDVTGNNI